MEHDGGGGAFDAASHSIAGYLTIPKLLDNPYLPFLVVIVLLILIYGHQTKSSKPHLAPLVNPKRPFEFTNERVRKEFITNCKGLIHDWFKIHPDKPMRVNGDVGEYTILPPSMIAEVDKEHLVSLTRWSYKVRVELLPNSCYLKR